MTPSIVMIAFAAVRVSTTRWSCSSKESNVNVELTGPPEPLASMPASTVVVAVVTLVWLDTAEAIAVSILVIKSTRSSVARTSTEISNFSSPAVVKSKDSVPAPPVSSPLTVRTLPEIATPNAAISSLPLLTLLRPERLAVVAVLDLADRNCVSPVVEVIVRELSVPASDLISNLTPPAPVSMISAPTPVTSFKASFRPSTVLLVELITTSYDEGVRELQAVVAIL